MKTIIQRSLPLNTKYHLIDKKYIPLMEGMGCTCQNCGQLIANIATVKNDIGKSYNIGFDCLETLLINNNLLSTYDVADYERAKKMIPRIKRFAKIIDDVINNSPTVTGILFEKPIYETDWFTFYWLHHNKTESRDNDNIKLKEMEFDFLVTTLQHIFPKLNVMVKFNTIKSK